MRISTDTYFADFTVRHFPSKGTPFVTVDMNGEGNNTATIYLSTPDECRKLRAAVDRAEALLVGQYDGGTDAS